MAMLDPTLAILDETDSGLDVDALRIVANGVTALYTPEKAAIVITAIGIWLASQCFAGIIL